ncbi:MGMT family protein [Acinetobacter sp. MD2]|uniref:MGMT family protein n=1 Tax=Acinetobacter sp. MD2 TaxID=2600066 RepID=UPI002D1E5498|nr:MGMT family protein [Acinetobacter sp. MD2]MEB3767947.1 MGMT family protein [Acinetobacter sp. MD2]
MSSELYAYILTVVAQIPRGKVASYGQIAKMAGFPKHARLVGRVLKQIADDAQIPWHRVVDAKGHIRLTKQNQQGENLQQLKLIDEGVLVVNGKICLSDYQWFID